MLMFLELPSSGKYVCGTLLTISKQKEVDEVSALTLEGEIQEVFSLPTQDKWTKRETR